MLTENGVQQIIRCYSVVGKVLAADLIDTEKLQNHFLIAAASLGSQLLKTYDIGVDKKGKPIELSSDKISHFFFEILLGKISIQDLQGSFELNEIIERFN